MFRLSYRAIAMKSYDLFEKSTALIVLDSPYLIFARKHHPLI